LKEHTQLKQQTTKAKASTEDENFEECLRAKPMNGIVFLSNCDVYDCVGANKNLSTTNKDEVHCVKVPEPMCKTSDCEVAENSKDFNFVENFDKIVADYIEDALVK